MNLKERGLAPILSAQHSGRGLWSFTEEIAETRPLNMVLDTRNRLAMKRKKRMVTFSQNSHTSSLCSPTKVFLSLVLICHVESWISSKASIKSQGGSTEE
jgi:hypothetical protein